MSGFDFLDEIEDSEGAPEVEANEPEVEETEGAQEEPTEQEEAEDVSEDEEELEVVELDGEEVTLDQLREWKRGNLREQDYTKKTQALAEERKTLASKLSEIDSTASALLDAESEIFGLLVADLDEIDLKQLRKDDYEEYSRIKEERAEREDKLKAIKAKVAEARNVVVAQEQEELVRSLGWDDSSKKQADVDAFNDLAKELGLSDRDMKTLTSAKVMGALIEFAKIKKASSVTAPKPERKKVKISKKRSAPVTITKARTYEDELNDFFV